MPGQKRTITESEEWERGIEDTVEAYKSGKFSSLRQAVQEAGFDRRTITARLNGRPTRRKAQEATQHLSHAEEEELGRAIRIATLRGKPLQPQLVRVMAEAIRKRRVKGVNEDGIILVDYEALGKRWLDRFKKRQWNLSTERVEKIEAVRNAITAEELEKWFIELDRVVRDFNILPESMYNMDETGFNIGDFEARQCIVDTTVNCRYQAQPGRQEWVTSIECISVDGSSIPPTIIFTGENFVKAWHSTNFDPTWKVSNSSKGWTSNEHAMMWLRQCFKPRTRDKADGRHRLLICDGHDSHSTADFLGHCIEHKILLFLLIPHSSHIVQPLDAGIFQAVKLRLSGYVAPTLDLGATKIPKVEWLEALRNTQRCLFNPKHQIMFFKYGDLSIQPCKRYQSDSVKGYGRLEAGYITRSARPGDDRSY